MKKIKKFFLNASIMVLTTVLLRIISLYFSVWVSRKVGEEGIGIYQLTLSLYRLGITLSSAGIGFSATRIIAEEIEKKNPREALRAASRCLTLSLMFGVTIALIFFFFADFLGEGFLGDRRSVLTVKAMSISFPFIVMSSVIGAYFTAVRRVSKNAVGMFADQFVRMAVTYIMLLNFDGENLEYASFSLAMGGILAEIISFLITYIFYNSDRKYLWSEKHQKTQLGRRIASIALPVGISSCIRSSLLSIEHMMIPRGLKKRGVKYSRALGLYGMISGMVFPVIMFPSAFLYAASDLIVPEFAAASVSEDKLRLKRLTRKVMQLTSYFAVGAAGIMFGFSYEIGEVFYDSTECGYYIKLLAPLVVFMLYDHLADAILKGLGEQVSVVKYNIIDSVTSVLLVYFLVPIFGLGGYIFVVWFGEVLNCIMSGAKLIKRTKASLQPVRFFLLPTIAVTFSITLTRTLLSLIHNSVADNLLSLIVAISICALIYIFILRLFGCITIKDYRMAVKVIKN